jgi:hypothetical protein
MTSPAIRADLRQKKALETLLKTHSAIKCMACGQSVWKAEQVGSLPEATLGSHGVWLIGKEQAPAVPVAILECSSCGLLLSFSLSKFLPSEPEG